MSDKVKPWHQRRPKHGERDKRIAPVRPGSIKRNPSFRYRDEEESQDTSQRERQWKNG